MGRADALQSVRSAVSRAGGARARRARRPGARAGGDLPRALELRARGAAESADLALHGPNGSAKSTVAACIMRALEHYSTHDEGALYRFHWVFPNQARLRGAIGFGAARRLGATAGGDGSYAHLPDDEIDARLLIEVRDHPLFLLPQAARAELLERLYAEAGVRGAAAGVDPARQPLAQEPAGLRGAALELRRLARRGAAPRAGRALLHLAALPHGRGHDRSPAVRRRGRAADHGGPQRRGAARRAPGGDALRGVRRARRRGGRHARVFRPVEAPARRLQVPADHGRDGRGAPALAERARQLRADRRAPTSFTSRRSASTPSSRASAGGSSSSGRRTC